MRKLFCFLLLLLSSSLLVIEAQSHVIDSLNQALKTEKDDTNKVKTWNALSFTLLNSSRYDSALIYARKALALAILLGDDKGTGNAYTNIGLYYYSKSDFPAALNSFQKGLNIFQKIGNKKGIINCLGSFGDVYYQTGNYSKSLENSFKALALDQEIGNTLGTADILNNIGIIYSAEKNYAKALEYYKKSLELNRKIGNKNNESSSLANIGVVYMDLQKFDTALLYDLTALNLFRQAGDRESEALDLNCIGDIYLGMEKYDTALLYEFKALSINKETGYVDGSCDDLCSIGLIYTKQKKYADSKTFLDSALRYARKTGRNSQIKEVYLNMSELDSAKGDYKSGWEEYRKYILYRDSLLNEAAINKSTQAEMNYEFGRKTDSAKAVQAIADAVTAKEKQREKVVRNAFVGGFSIMLLAAIVFFFQRKRIAKEKKRSDELLLNILPEEVAEELKDKGSADAKQFDEVTVLFTDFKDFTKISEKLTAKELVAEIDYCFKGFDNIIHKYEIEKIKTIGDSYMAAGGLPVTNKTHANDVVSAALEIIKFMEEHKQQRIKEGRPIFEIRIGINTGPVVAGIVGVKKFAYDIWGDTVNLASRMESSGEPGRVNISGSTYELVKNDFTCSYRGKIQAKNKGEVDMYFVVERLS